MADTDINLWFNEHKYKALQSYLPDDFGGIEQVLYDLLEDHYKSYVPQEEQQKIDHIIQKEDEESEIRLQRSRRFAVVIATEKLCSNYSSTECFQTDIYTTVPKMAQRCRLALSAKKSQGKSFDSLIAFAFPVRTPITPEEVIEANLDFRNNPSLQASVEINFYQGRFSYLTEDGWRIYPLEEVVKAAWIAYRKHSLSESAKENLFFQNLDSLMNPQAEQEFDTDEAPGIDLGT